MARKDANKIIVHDHMLGNDNKAWGDNELLYHRDNIELCSCISKHRMLTTLDLYKLYTGFVYNLWCVLELVPSGAPESACLALSLIGHRWPCKVLAPKQSCFNCLKVREEKEIEKRRQASSPGGI